jgi:hypothetical protein
LSETEDLERHLESDEKTAGMLIEPERMVILKKSVKNCIRLSRRHFDF